MTLDRDALIEAMALADYRLDFPNDCAMPDVARERYTDGAEAALPVAVRAILAPLREAHSPDGCNCCDLTICEGCVTRYPCPTVRLLDAIEADLIGDTE